MLLVWESLQDSKDAQLAAIAAKSLKETRYHLRHARDWLVRLGDGTEESHARMQAALDHLMPYTQEFWTVSPAEAAAVSSGTGVDTRSIREAWDHEVDCGAGRGHVAPAAAGRLRPARQGRTSLRAPELCAG